MKTRHLTKKKSKKRKVEIFYFFQMLNESTKSIKTIIAIKKNAIYCLYIEKTSIEFA